MNSKPRKRNTVRKVKNRRKINWKRLGYQLSCFVAFAGMVAGVCWLLTTPQLAVTAVKPQGNRITEDRAIISLANNALGRNMFLLGGSKIKKSVMRRPELLDVKIIRKLPHTLVLSVTERKAIAVVTTGSGYYEIDNTGLIFHRVSHLDSSLPLICLEDSIRLQPGLHPSNRGLTAAMDCLTLCNKNDFVITKLSVDPASNICLNMGGGFYVKLGQAEQIEEKLSIIRSTLRARPEIGRKALYIDVSCPSAPAWKPKSKHEEPEV